MAKKAVRGFKPYKSYSFKAQDPVIESIRAIVEDSGMKRIEVHERSGVSTGTMCSWFSGRTRRPQFATVNAVARACGQELVFRSTSLKR